jgi:glycerol-3-phosphate O-acyltransferase
VSTTTRAHPIAERLTTRPKTAHGAVEDLMASPGFRADLERLARELGRDGQEVAAETRGYLEELATRQSRVARRIWSAWSHFLWRRAYELEVDVEGMERLRELNKQYPIVFLPSHKANLDGFVMASVMYDQGFPGTHVLGGINMGFFPLGTLGRRTGVIWIRRSFGGNELYKFALRRYLAHLASQRLNLEWYIEGGRSRTGKLLPPKMGLLNYLAQGVEEAGVEEILMAPVSIVYDRLNEVVEMTAEARGAKKRPEGIGWLLRYARSHTGRLGRIQVNFGEPVPLRAALAAAPAGDDAARRLALSKAAFEVSTRINRATPVTTTSLVTLALLGVDGWAVTAAQAQRVIEPLRRYVLQRELPGSETLVELESDAGTRHTLETLVEHGVVERFDAGSEPVYRIGPDRELAAAFYRNVVIHWFVNRAIVELSLVAATESEEGEDPMAAALDEAFALRDLLKFEFFFAEKQEFQDELRAEVALIDPAWREKGGEGLQQLGGALADSGGLMADRILRSFLEAYYVVADRLAAHGGEGIDQDAFVHECLGVGQQYHLQRRIVSGEAVSAELFKTGLKLAGNRGLLEAGGPEVKAGRATLARELHELLRRLEILAGWDRTHRVRREGVT